MGSIAGIVVVFGMVFGGYILAGGKLDIIIAALPFELMMIGGAAVGAFLIANTGNVIKGTLKDIGRVFKKEKWSKEDKIDLLCLLFSLIKVYRNDPVAIEGHIEDPSESSIFQNFPKILADNTSIQLICDTIRMGMLNFDDPHQVEEVLNEQLEKEIHGAEKTADALQTVADGLPALGIVAAVLGVIKTMGSIDQPPEILGKMIGGALVGTFLGVFLAYAFVGPFATKIRASIEAEHKFHNLIKDVLLANLQRHSPQICVEVARQQISRKSRPSFSELEEALKSRV